MAHVVGKLIPELEFLFFARLCVCVIVGCAHTCMWVEAVFMFHKARSCLLFELVNQNYSSVSIPDKSCHFTVPVSYYTKYICIK